MTQQTGPQGSSAQHSSRGAHPWGRGGEGEGGPRFMEWAERADPALCSRQGLC